MHKDKCTNIDQHNYSRGGGGGGASQILKVQNIG